jgi:hypothetical protein
MFSAVKLSARTFTVAEFIVPPDVPALLSATTTVRLASW